MSVSRVTSGWQVMRALSFLCFSLVPKFSVTDTKCFIYYLNEMFIRNIIFYYFLQYIGLNVFSVYRCTRVCFRQLKGIQQGVT